MRKLLKNLLAQRAGATRDTRIPDRFGGRPGLCELLSNTRKTEPARAVKHGGVPRILAARDVPFVLSRRALLGAACGAAYSKSTEVLRLRARRAAREAILEWKPSETAIIICDMWDNHYCQNAAGRVKAMAPRMDQVLKQARGIGVTIIHAPSGTMDVYAGTPQRLRLMNAPKVTPPVPIMKSCPLDRGREGPLPVDDVTQPCDDAVVGPAVRRYNRENELLYIAEQDGISDDEEEIYSYFHQRKIRNVVLMGVHTNMCVLGRSFGIRQQVRLGMNVVLARDLTDAMYDPRQRPFVSHEKGTALIISHIEKYWCSSVLSEDLTHLA